MKTTTFILILIAGMMLLLSSVGHASSDVQSPLPGESNTEEGLPVGPVMLNAQINIVGEIITLGDLFINTGDKSGKAVAYSPKPGRKAFYDAKWLYRVARYYGLDWKPTTSKVRVVVIRESITIKYNEIVDAVMSALSLEDIPAGMLAELSNRNMQLYLPADISPEIAVEDLAYDNRSQRFSAVIVAPANHPDAQRHRITGKLFKMIEIPVLNRYIQTGEIITKNDIEWHLTRTEKISRDTITTLEDIIGKSPKRGLRPGFQIRSTEIRAPILIRKKTLITISLKNQFMTLTAQGRAMQNGSLGDVIRVTNIQSNTIVDAEVVGAGRVIVRTAPQITQMSMN